MNLVANDGRIDHALDLQAQLLEMRLTQLAHCRYRVLVVVAPEDDPQLVSVATNVSGACRGKILADIRENFPDLVRADPLAREPAVPRDS